MPCASFLLTFSVFNQSLVNRLFKHTHQINKINNLQLVSFLLYYAYTKQA